MLSTSWNSFKTVGEHSSFSMKTPHQCISIDYLNISFLSHFICLIALVYLFDCFCLFILLFPCATSHRPYLAPHVYHRRSLMFLSILWSCLSFYLRLNSTRVPWLFFSVFRMNLRGRCVHTSDCYFYF